MNLRLQKYKKNRLAGMNIVNAARAAGYSESFAKGKACRLEKSVKVSMADAFEQAGLTDKAIIAHALEGISANKVISCNIVALNKEGMKDADSMTKDFIDVPDWMARHKYFETILQLINKLKANGIDISNHIHITHFYLPEQKQETEPVGVNRLNGLETPA